MKQPGNTWRFEALRLLSRMGKTAERLSGCGKSLDMATLVPLYAQIWKNAADGLRADFREIAHGFWRVSLNGASTLIHNFKVQIDDPVVMDMAGNKALCYRLFAERGLPVPDHAVFTLRRFEDARRFMERHRDAHFVVKPSRGTSGGRGVTTHVRTPGECRRAAALASLYGEELIIERLVPGESFRILVLDGRVIHATRRRGVRVNGDGNSTLLELLTRSSSRRDGFDRRRAAADRDFQATLAAQGLSAATVLPAGREVLAKSCPFALSVGREFRTQFNEDITAALSTAVRDEAVHAAAAVGSRFAGVDLITLDPAKSLVRAGGVINEINTTPGLHHHYQLLNPAHSLPAADVLSVLLQGHAAARKANGGTTGEAVKEMRQ